MLGLKRGTVKLVPHNLKWAKLFEKEKEILKEVFGDTIIAIEHIGSTAVPGIPAKPIIDISIAIESLEIAKVMNEKFEKLGYQHRPFVPKHNNIELQSQELFVKGPESRRTFYVHVTNYGSEKWKSDLLFRDYLRKYPKSAKEYAELKLKLAERYSQDRETYTKSKDSFIKSILEIAHKELNRKNDYT